MEELVADLRADIATIREVRDRTGSMDSRPLRWVGCPPNPNGWRLMGDLANDLETLLNLLEEVTN